MADHDKIYDCPVCEAVQLQKLSPSEELELVLDYCDDCGGMWFDAGEVRQLHLCSPEVLSGRITMKKQLHTVECSKCGFPMTRATAACGACGRENILDCPGCGSELERVQSENFTVDVCRACRGVWFDNLDLSQVWNLQIGNSNHSEGMNASPSSEDGRTEDTVIAILRHSRGGGGENDGSEADDRSVDGSGDHSGNVFDSIADIIGGIFSGSD